MFLIKNRKYIIYEEAMICFLPINCAVLTAKKRIFPERATRSCGSSAQGIKLIEPCILTPKLSSELSIAFVPGTGKIWANGFDRIASWNKLEKGGTANEMHIRIAKQYLFWQDMLWHKGHK